ncbi:hypothetical protein ACFFIX_00670 [Metabacillus herbersteinensis]|uniref:Lipoprotein n=1 Tax=Metabacillus herbersteinensis TaxID=283816 RepID=A0ABV6G8K3_9BACI
MKKIAVLSLILLMGCSQEAPVKVPPAIEITPMDLTDREIKILQGFSGDEVLAYDLKVTNLQEKIIQVTIEHYHNGKKEEDPLDFGSEILNAEQETSVLISRTRIQENDEIGSYQTKAVLIDQTGYSSFQSAPVNYDEPFDSSIFNKLEESKKVNLDDEVVIGVTVEGDGSQGLSGGTLDENEPEFKTMIQQNKDVFVYKIKIVSNWKK